MDVIAYKLIHLPRRFLPSSGAAALLSRQAMVPTSTPSPAGASPGTTLDPGPLWTRQHTQNHLVLHPKKAAGEARAHTHTHTWPPHRDQAQGPSEATRGNTRRNCTPSPSSPPSLIQPSVQARGGQGRPLHNEGNRATESITSRRDVWAQQGAERARASPDAPH